MKYFLALLISYTALFSFSQYQSLLWKISGNGLKSESYLLGTMHVADSRAFTKIDSIKQRLNQCHAYAMEIIASENDVDMSLMFSLLMKDGTTLSKLFTKDEYQTLDSLLEASTGYSIALLDKMQPILLSVLLEQSGMTADSAAPLDFYLLEWAEKNNKKLIGIETVQEQLQALQALSYKEQAQMIKDELKKKNNTSFADQLFKLYTEENLDSIVILNQQNPMPAKLEKALLTDRNKIMAERIAGIIQQQSTFCAIGALHLPTPTGVIERLRKKGFKVEAIK